MRISVTQSGRRSVLVVLVCFVSVIGSPFAASSVALSVPAFFLCGFLSEVAAREADGGAHGSQPVIDTGVGRVLRVLQFLQCEVGRGDQRLAASVTAVNHAVNLFQPVFCPSLHTKIIKYQQGVAAKAGNIFVPALKAGGKVTQYRCKVCHAHRDFLLHKGVGDTGGKVAFSRPHASPKQVADIFSLHGFPALHIKAGRFRSVGFCRCHAQMSSSA